MPGKDGRDGAPGLDGEKVCKVLLKHCGKDFCSCPECAAKLLTLVERAWLETFCFWKALASGKFSKSVRVKLFLLINPKEIPERQNMHVWAIHTGSKLNLVPVLSGSCRLTRGLQRCLFRASDRCLFILTACRQRAVRLPSF